MTQFCGTSLLLPSAKSFTVRATTGVLGADETRLAIHFMWGGHLAWPQIWPVWRRSKIPSQKKMAKTVEDSGEWDTWTSWLVWRQVFGGGGGGRRRTRTRRPLATDSNSYPQGLVQPAYPPNTVFVSNCKMYFSQNVKCICLKYSGQWPEEGEDYEATGQWQQQLPARPRATCISS